MAFPQGINFRGTSGYVTDGANEDYEISSTVNYPRTSAQGNNVGWETIPSGGLFPGNDDSTYDRRIAGYAYNGSPTGVVTVYRVDLPSSGDYKIRVASGNKGYSRSVNIAVRDTTTSLGTLCSTTTTGSYYRDAVDAEYTAANWPGSNSQASLTFSTTICRIDLGLAGSKPYCFLNHLYIESAGGAATTRGAPFGTRGTAFNGGRPLLGIMRN